MPRPCDLRWDGRKKGHIPPGVLGSPGRGRGGPRVSATWHSSGPRGGGHSGGLGVPDPGFPCPGCRLGDYLKMIRISLRHILLGQKKGGRGGRGCWRRGILAPNAPGML